MFIKVKNVNHLIKWLVHEHHKILALYYIFMGELAIAFALNVGPSHYSVVFVQ